MSRIAWHYTTSEQARAIVASGEIRPATAGTPEGETPVVWFSTARTWEPTASKGVMTPNGIRTLTFPEMVKVGIARFAVDIDAINLLPWPRLRVAANITSEMADSMARAGRKAGANPRDWWGLLRPLRLDECLRVERFVPEQGAWMEGRP